MNRRTVSLFIAGVIIVMILLIGGAVLSVILKGSASLPPLPDVPTFSFSTSIPVATASPVPPSPVAATDTLPAGTATQTPQPLFILNGTPVFPTRSNLIAARTATRTPTPLSASVQTFTPTSTSIVQQAQTCKNILYPVAAGQQWRYRVTALSRTDILNMAVLSVNNSQGSVQVSNESTGSTKQVPVQCDGDVIRSFPLLSVDALFGSSLGTNLTASYISGVLAPNEAAFLHNNWALSWSSQYLVSGTTTLNRSGANISVTLNNAPVTLSCQTLGSGDAAFETITVGAGTFRALKVVCTESGQVSAIVNGITVSGLAEGRSNQWFAPKIGLVKMQVTAVSLRVFDLPFSLLTDNSLELLSYVQAP
jgi:hypothetical protein